MSTAIRRTPREVSTANAFGRSHHKAKVPSTNWWRTLQPIPIATRPFLRDNLDGASVNWWPGATVCTVPFRQLIWFRMRLVTSVWSSESGAARLLETHVSADTAIEPLPGEIGRAARDRGHRARLSGRLWRAQAFAWHTRRADGRRHRGFRFA